jgi:methyl-accepting chemotaxis protein
MRELSLGSERITESLSGLVRISGEVRSDSRSMRELVNRVGGSMQSVDVLAQENKVGMDEVSKGAEEIAKAAISLANLSTLNSDNMTKLETEISRFKTGA